MSYNAQKRGFLIICACSKYKVSDISGKIVIDGNGTKVDVSKLKSGVYFVKVENSKSTKIIKE